MSTSDSAVRRPACIASCSAAMVVSSTVASRRPAPTVVQAPSSGDSARPPTASPPRRRNSLRVDMVPPSEHDEAAGQLAPGQGAKRLVRFVERIAARDELIDLQLAGQVEGGQSRQVAARPRAAGAAARADALPAPDPTPVITEQPMSAARSSGTFLSTAIAHDSCTTVREA